MVTLMPEIKSSLHPDDVGICWLCGHMKETARNMFFLNNLGLIEKRTNGSEGNAFSFFIQVNEIVA